MHQILARKLRNPATAATRTQNPFGLSWPSILFGVTVIGALGWVATDMVRTRVVLVDQGTNGKLIWRVTRKGALDRCPGRLSWELGEVLAGGLTTTWATYGGGCADTVDDARRQIDARIADLLT